MNSIILQIATRYLKTIFLIFAVIALWQGHNHPGGGFIGGLIASLATVYSSIAYTNKTIRSRIKVKPTYFIGIGLICALTSLLPSILLGSPIMKGYWVVFDMPVFGLIKLGTPLIFDIGVFFTVIGITLMFLFTLSINEE